MKKANIILALVIVVIALQGILLYEALVRDGDTVSRIVVEHTTEFIEDGEVYERIHERTEWVLEDGEWAVEDGGWAID